MAFDARIDLKLPGSILVVLGLVLTDLPVCAGSEPFWIWHTGDGQSASELFARRTFHVSNRVRSAELRVVGGATNRVHLNGAPLDFSSRDVDVTSLLRLGRNVLSVQTRAEKRPGLIALLVITLTTGQRHVIASDREWKTAGRDSPEWTALDFDDSAWASAKSLAPHGAEPWGKVLRRD